MAPAQDTHKPRSVMGLGGGCSINPKGHTHTHYGGSWGGLNQMAPWPDGHGLGLLIRRVRVRVPQVVLLAGETSTMLWLQACEVSIIDISGLAHPAQGSIPSVRFAVSDVCGWPMLPWPSRGVIDTELSPRVVIASHIGPVAEWVGHWSKHCRFESCQGHLFRTRASQLSLLRRLHT